eukprot:PhF_6_TR41327/c0_g1_i4/m.62645
MMFFILCLAVLDSGPCQYALFVVSVVAAVIAQIVYIRRKTVSFILFTMLISAILLSPAIAVDYRMTGAFAMYRGLWIVPQTIAAEVIPLLGGNRRTALLALLVVTITYLIIFVVEVCTLPAGHWVVHSSGDVTIRHGDMYGLPLLSFVMLVMRTASIIVFGISYEDLLLHCEQDHQDHRSQRMGSSALSASGTQDVALVESNGLLHQRVVPKPLDQISSEEEQHLEGIHNLPSHIPTPAGGGGNSTGGEY